MKIMIENMAKNNVKNKLREEGVNYKDLKKRDFSDLVKEEEKRLILTWGGRGAIAIITGGLLGF